MGVDTVDRLHDMMAKLTNRLIEAEDIRVRFLKARDANRWPHLCSTSRLFTDIQNPTLSSKLAVTVSTLRAIRI